MKRLFHMDSRPIPASFRTATSYTTSEDAYRQFTAGAQQTPVTPADAFRGLTAGETESLIAARQRMLRRYGLSKDSVSAAAARERMLQRQERKERS